MNRFRTLFIVIFLLCTGVTFSQTVPVGMPGADDNLHILQLMGKLDPDYSLTARPFYNCKAIDSNFEDRAFKYAVLPVGISVKYNSHHPYGWNDGGMIMSKGLQTSITAGVYAKAGPLSVQFKPEWVHATNAAYETTPDYGFNSGNPFNKIYAGQSAIRLNLGPISVGASTENLWWGPGQFSSLLMSNNAPGFEHLNFNTTRPLKTPIGSFEWQLIAARLSEDSSEVSQVFFMKPLPTSTKNLPRYLNGIALTFQPKFMKGFFLGITRTVQFYEADLRKSTNSFIPKWLPVLTGASPEANADPNSIQALSDGAFSLFTRWILPKYQSEFYLEYGYNDFKQNMRDFTTNANHSSAYILGFKKLIPLHNSRLFDISGEITQMAQSTSYIVRTAGNWYEHWALTQGFTNNNQILGAGSGMGNNVQTFQIRYLFANDYVGLKLQRIQQDPKRTNGGLSTIGMTDIQWNDLSLGFLGQKKWNRFLVNAEMQLVSSKNYGWKEGNAFNLYALVNALYFF